MPAIPLRSESRPDVHHRALKTVFRGILHSASDVNMHVHQFRGIKYASVPGRFRQSKLFKTYPSVTDATTYGPICPQVTHGKTMEEALFKVADNDVPKQAFKQNELECLNLNITCPAGPTPLSRLPVMAWIHGGGDRGYGSNWVYDGGALVKKSMLNGTPVIIVNFNYRLGLFGFACSPALKEKCLAAGEDGVGNFGLRDQCRAIEWLHNFIGEFGGDPTNITLFGESTGAASIVYHLLSTYNEVHPQFQRAIIQSPVLDTDIPNVSSAGWHLTRIMGIMGFKTIDQLQTADVAKLVPYGHIVGLGVVDDGVFLRKDWKHAFSYEDVHQHQHHIITSASPHGAKAARTIHLPANLQPLIIGDCASDALLWSLPASYWSSEGIVRRLKAICQSLSKASHLLGAYNISAHTADDEITDRVLDVINDTRIAWPTECIAQSSKHRRGGHGVWRYIFDQEGPTRGVPHHAVDLIYLFDNVALPECTRSTHLAPVDYPESYGDFSDDEEVYCGEFESGWFSPSVEPWAYAHIRDTIQERWIAFAYGKAPWNEDKVFVFGPEGETGERSSQIFNGRRRTHIWKNTLNALGVPLVQKVGMELSRGPSMGGNHL